MRAARGPYTGFKLERRAPSPALLFVHAKLVRDSGSTTTPVWMPAWALHRDSEGNWVIRQWSWFSRGWWWRRITRPERISVYSRSGRG